MSAMPTFGVVRPGAQDGPIVNGPRFEGCHSLIHDTPKVAVRKDPDKRDAGEEVIDLHDVPADYFHPNGQPPFPEFTLAQRKKQIARVHRRSACYLGGPTLDEALAQAKAAGVAARVSDQKSSGRQIRRGK